MAKARPYFYIKYKFGLYIKTNIELFSKPNFIIITLFKKSSNFFRLKFILLVYKKRFYLYKSIIL